MSSIRLQKVLSAAGVASRRAAEELMRAGRVTINGVVASTPGVRADPGRDDIRVDGRRIRPPAERRYILLNKPKGYVTTRRDPQGRPTVMDLVAGIREYLYPVGRLDFESEGLLLLTNDGELAARLMHPRHGVARAYEVRVKGVPEARALKRLAQGLVLDGRQTAPAAVELIRSIRREGGEQSVLRLAVHEGRNRLVRRMCEAVGYPAMRLRRVQFGPLSDTRLRPGQCRDLRRRELVALRRAAGMTDRLEAR